MKICIVTTMFPKYKGDYYGSFVFDEVKAIVDRGFEVHVITQHNSGIPYEEDIDGIKIHRFRWLEPKTFRALVHFKGFKDNLRLLTYIFSLFINLIKIIRKYDIEIIHAHSTIPTGLLGVIVSKIMRIPIVITAHGMDINNFENKILFKQLLSFSLRHCNKAIAVSADLAKKMNRIGAEEHKIVILRNTVNTKLFKPIKNQKIRNTYGIEKEDVLILFVGYLDTFKGIFDTIDAFYKIINKKPNVKLIMVGTGPEENTLKKRVSKLGLEKAVIFTGKLPPTNLPEYYQAADIFVLPSYTEGLPLSILEAMSCGLPIITTNVGGIPEVVENGKNGFIIDPGDADKLKEKLEKITVDENLRDKFSEESTKIIATSPMNSEDKINILIELYNHLK